MEKTDKAKIGFAVLLVLLAVRLVLGFFPTDLETVPYSTDSEPRILTEANVKEIRFCFGAERLKKPPLYFYRITTDDGKAGFLISEEKYKSEVLDEPFAVKGNTMRMPESLEQERTELQNWADVIFEDGYFKEHNGSEDAAYAPFASVIALDLTNVTTTKDNPACLWVNLAAFAAFCYMLTMLLAEYASRKEKKKRKPTD